MILLVLSAGAQTLEAEPRTPITELDHPNYLDAAGEPVSWSQIRAWSADTGALGRVRRRRLGRTVLRVAFAAATVAEVWGTTELARHGHWTAYPLAAQASLTGLCEVLLWTRLPQDRIEDHALVVDALNQAHGRSSP